VNETEAGDVASNVTEAGEAAHFPEDNRLSRRQNLRPNAKLSPEQNHSDKLHSRSCNEHDQNPRQWNRSRPHDGNNRRVESGDCKIIRRNNTKPSLNAHSARGPWRHQTRPAESISEIGTSEGKQNEFRLHASLKSRTTQYRDFENIPEPEGNQARRNPADGAELEHTRDPGTDEGDGACPGICFSGGVFVPLHISLSRVRPRSVQFHRRFCYQGKRRPQ
jgi:hypothetical protein